MVLSSQYTPTDLAEYILRTGDEEGVAIAVEELLRQGMVRRREDACGTRQHPPDVIAKHEPYPTVNLIHSREEAIVYLQDVKAEMNYIRAQQEKLRKIQELREAISMKKKDELKGKPTAKSPTKAAASKEVAPPSSAAVATENKAVPAAAHGSDASKSKAARVDAGGAEAAQKRDSAAASNKLGVLERLGEEQRQRQQEADGLLRRLRGPSPYDEYTLEEIIYWLAKDMFAHSIVKGDQSAEEALARFANFVETEVSQNKLSGEVEKKVLDIMLAALVDILREFPGPQYSGTNPLPPQRLFPEATENQAAKLANARLRNAAIRLREEKMSSCLQQRADEVFTSSGNTSSELRDTLLVVAEPAPPTTKPTTQPPFPGVSAGARGLACNLAILPLCVEMYIDTPLPATPAYRSSLLHQVRRGE
ncbi:hypothetical protein HPB48_016019 [Haemaphysalis longicornis]|uniref:Uncharacterized protein n=1 Tax=Haemaphysalis longicornis TaxID=44386 RepID=A0A9J6G1X3_HAELO|nr:hypothetical protein HPB48_016019 [Haemaphysalis longicornis]